MKEPHETEQVEQVLQQLRQFKKLIPRGYDVFEDFYEFYQAEKQKYKNMLKAMKSTKLKRQHGRSSQLEPTTKTEKKKQTKQTKEFMEDVENERNTQKKKKKKQEEMYESPSQGQSEESAPELSSLNDQRKPSKKETYCLVIEQQSKQISSIKKQQKIQLTSSQEENAKNEEQEEQGINENQVIGEIEMEDEDEDDVARQMKMVQKQNIKEEVKIDPQKITLDCGHTFKEEGLLEYFQRKSRGRVKQLLSDESNPVKCQKCFHLITKTEIAKVIEGKAEDNCESKETLGKVQDVCSLCDQSKDTKSADGIHFFCKECWKGVVVQYGKQVGCLNPGCSYFYTDLNNLKIKQWIVGWQIEREAFLKNKQSEREMGIQAKTGLENQESNKCETCKQVFRRWNFKNCSGDCRISLCKKCTKKVYSSEVLFEIQCFTCFEKVEKDEILQIINLK